ncbi:MAG: ornithine carbamoyltransferase [Spirochaetota bacterium]
MYSGFKNKHLLRTQDWTVEEIEKCIKTAARLKEERQLGICHDHILKAKTFFMLFFEESTRTRNAFEAGVHQLGGHAHFLTPKATQIDHGETARDTIKVLSRYGEGIGIRKTFGEGFKYMQSVAENAEIPVINMQCEIYHPTQALADLMTIKEKFNGELRGRKFVISWTYGPNYIRPLSMPHSLILLMSRFGMDVTLSHPKEFSLRPDILKQAEANAKEAGVKFVTVDRMEEAVEDAHIVYAKSWGPIMHTEDEKEGLSLIDKYPRWVVDQGKMNLASPDAIYMHCMPVDRDIEVTSEVLDGPQSAIYDEAENRLHINKALMALTMAS